MRSTEYLSHLSCVAGHGFEQALDALNRCADLGLPATALGDVLRSLQAQRDQIDSVFVRLVGRLDDELRRSPNSSPAACAAWLQTELDLETDEAAGWVFQARMVRGLMEPSNIIELPRPDPASPSRRGGPVKRRAARLARPC